MTTLMKRLFPVYLFFIFLVSCESKSDNNEQAVAPSVLPATNPISTVTNDSSGILKTDSSVALNPQHGQPGHRCDIAVGAPLNAPAANNSIQQAVTPTITPSTTTITPATTAITPSTTTITTSTPETKKVTPNSNAATGALNPKHGEPGHRCDIAVGAPLNSKPTQ